MASDLLRYRLELNIDGTWVDMADPATLPEGELGRLRVQPPPTLSSGQQNETSSTRPTKFACRLANKDGALTPRRAMGQWYPHIGAGMRTRLSFHGATSQLQLAGAGSRATTPDHAALHLVEPFLGVEIAAPVMLPVPGAPYALTGRWDAAGNQRSDVLYLFETGHLGFNWSEDGTAVTGVGSFNRMLVPVAGGVAAAVGFVPDDGAGNQTWVFYAGHRLDDILADPAGHILDTGTFPATTSVHPGTAPLEVGDIAGASTDGFSAYPGLIRRAQAREGGIGGTLAADLDVTGLDEGAAGTTDSAGRVWAFTNAEVTRWRTVRVLTVDQIQPLPHPVDGLQVVDLTASGPMRRLGQGATGLQSTLRRRVASAELAPNIEGYWPFEDGPGSTQAASALPGAAPGKVFETVQFGADNTLPGSKALPNVAGNTPTAWAVTVPVFTGTEWRVDVFARCPTVAISPAFTPLYTTHATGTVRSWVVEINNLTLQVRGLNDAGTQIVTTSIAAPDLDQFASISLRINQNGGNVECVLQYIDNTGTAAASATGTVAGTVGRPTVVGNLLTTPADGMSWGHVIVSHGLDPNWLLASEGRDVADGFTLERAADRLVRLGTEEGVPVRVHGGPGDTARMGPQRPDLDLLVQFRECAATDGGLFVEDPYQVGFVYRTRASMYNQSPRIVVDLAQPGARTPGPAEDDYGRRNLIEARRPGGSTALATTTPPPLPEETYRDEVDVNVPTDLHLPDQAGWALHLGTVEEMRYPQVPYLATTREQVEQLLEVGPGDLVRLTSLPADLAEVTVDQLVLGERTAMLPATWDTVLNCRPAAPWEIAVRDNAKRDTAGAELAADFDAGVDTSMSVATTLGLLWTTDAGHMPLRLFVGGAEVTVTAVTGATSPQTFTVSTTIPNGVVKTIPAGSPVRLWRPTIRA